MSYDTKLIHIMFKTNAWAKQKVMGNIHIFSPDLLYSIDDVKLIILLRN